MNFKFNFRLLLSLFLTNLLAMEPAPELPKKIPQGLYLVSSDAQKFWLSKKECELSESLSVFFDSTTTGLEFDNKDIELSMPFSAKALSIMTEFMKDMAKLNLNMNLLQNHFQMLLKKDKLQGQIHHIFEKSDEKVKSAMSKVLGDAVYKHCPKWNEPFLLDSNYEIKLHFKKYPCPEEYYGLLSEIYNCFKYLCFPIKHPILFIDDKLPMHDSLESSDKSKAHFIEDFMQYYYYNLKNPSLDGPAWKAFYSYFDVPTQLNSQEFNKTFLGSLPLDIKEKLIGYCQYNALSTISN